MVETLKYKENSVIILESIKMLMEEKLMDLKVLLSEEEIQDRLTQMAREIDTYYKGEEILVICVLRGAIYFMTDLTKKMKTPMALDFIRVSSYDGTETTGKINVVNDITEDIKGKKVLLVEDIIDTGYTLNALKEYLLSKEPEDLKVAVLADKKERRRVDVDIDFIGYEIPNNYVVGYGFDYYNTYRNLPYVGYIEN